MKKYSIPWWSKEKAKSFCKKKKEELQKRSTQKKKD
jgi:hypothetical protein